MENLNTYFLRDKKKNIFILAVLGTILGLLTLELLLRIFYWAGENRILGVPLIKTTIEWQNDDFLGRRLKPNQKGWFVSPTKEYFTWIDINSYGWRDSEHALEKSENTYRILIIGDSFVENFQVPLERTFFKQLEQNLNSETQNKNVEIIAMGLGDSGTAQQHKILKNFGLAYKPDFVVHFFFTGNDIKNNSSVLQGDQYRPYFRLVKGSLEEIPFQTREADWKYKIFLTLKNNIRVLEALLDLKGNFVGRLERNNNDSPVDYHVYDREYTKEYQDAWEVTQALILESKKLTEQNGAKYILVTTANNEQVSQNVWAEILKVYPNINQENIDLEKPDKLLKEFCEKEKIDCLFMLSYFKDQIKKLPRESTHFKKDGHWNKLGTDLVANFLTKNLTNYFLTR